MSESVSQILECRTVNYIFKLQIFGSRPGVDLNFTLDNNHNNNNDNHNDNNPYLNFFKGKVLGVKEQGLGIRDKGQDLRDMG